MERDRQAERFHNRDRRKLVGVRHGDDAFRESNARAWTGSLAGELYWQLPAAGQNVAVTVALTAASATITGTQSNAARTVALVTDTHHFVVIEPGLLAGLFALPAQLAAWNESTVTWLSPVTGSAQPLMKDPAAPPHGRPSGVPAQDVELSLTGADSGHDVVRRRQLRTGSDRAFRRSTRSLPACASVRVSSLRWRLLGRDSDIGR